MKLRAVRLRNLFLLVAIFASLVAFGSWDGRRDMRRVLESGYDAIVQITGAQYQRMSPLALEGWRPRFVEQRLSVNLKWDGRDGRRHEYRNVPVTDSFADTIVSGEQVTQAVLPARVLDDESGVPVIAADGPARFASLQEWMRGAVYLAFASWFGFLATTFWVGQERRMAVAGLPAYGRASSFPIRRILLGILALVIGAVAAIYGWSVEDATSSAKAGEEIQAEITAASTPSSGPAAGKHVVALSWKDGRGAVHHFGPVTVSDAFWGKITANGKLAVRQTSIRVQGEGADARPVIVEDTRSAAWKAPLLLSVGLTLLAIGAALLGWAARHLRNTK